MIVSYSTGMVNLRAKENRPSLSSFSSAFVTLTTS